MLQLFTNTESKKDYLYSEIVKQGNNVQVDIAVAFFTFSELVKKLVDNGCTIRLIIRLGFPTSPQSLKDINELDNVDVRYYTAKDFHSKLYIFGEKCAFVGSSNLTSSGLKSNQEVNISVDRESAIFEELRDIFSKYWSEAKPLTNEVIDLYSQIVLQRDGDSTEDINEIYSKLGFVKFNDIVFSNGDKDFLKDVDQKLRGEAARTAKFLLESVRSWYRGELSYRSPSKYYKEMPNNFWTALIQPRKNGLQITISGRPEKYHSDVFDLKLTFRAYTKYFLNTEDQLHEATRLIKESALRKGAI